MQYYHTTRTRRCGRVPNQISDSYWLAFRNLYGDRKTKPTVTPSAPAGKNITAVPHEGDLSSIEARSLA